ncbi:Exocyst complex component Sec8 [Entamoeba marina]
MSEDDSNLTYKGDGQLDEDESKEIRDCTQMVSPEFHSENFISLEKIIPILKDPIGDTGDLNVRLISAEKAMGIVVERYFSGFNKTIHNYSTIAQLMAEINTNMNSMQSGLKESRSRLFNKDTSDTSKLTDIKTLYQQRQEYHLVLHHINTIKWLMQVPQDIKQYIKQNHYLHAVVLLNRACDYGEQPAIQVVADLKHSFEEMQRERSEMVSVLELLCEDLCMKSSMNITSKSMTSAEIEYAKHQSINQFPHRYEHSDIDATLVTQENIALKADYDYNEQLLAVIQAALVLSLETGHSMMISVIENNMKSLDQVFALHRLSLEKNKKATLSFLDATTSQKIKAKTQHLSSVDRFELCCKIALRLLYTYNVICNNIEYFAKEKLSKYKETISLKELNVTWNKSAVTRLNESSAKEKRSRWASKFNKTPLEQPSTLQEEPTEQMDHKADFLSSSMQMTWNLMQTYLVKVLSIRVFETDEQKEHKLTKQSFTFAGGDENSEKEEQQSEKYRMAKKSLTADNVRKLLTVLRSFIENVKQICRIPDSNFAMLNAFIERKQSELREHLFLDF